MHLIPLLLAGAATVTSTSVNWADAWRFKFAGWESPPPHPVFGFPPGHGPPEGHGPPHRYPSSETDCPPGGFSTIVSSQDQTQAPSGSSTGVSMGASTGVATAPSSHITGLSTGPASLSTGALTKTLKLSTGTAYSTGTAVPMPTGSSNITCNPGVHIIFARGTTEQPGNTLMGVVIRDILATVPGSKASEVMYPASYASDSVTTGVYDTQQQLKSYYSACPKSRIVLMGYSQGAQVIGSALTIGSSQTKPPNVPISQTIGKNVAAVVLFGDPQQTLGQGINNEEGGCTLNATVPRSGEVYENMEFYANRLDEYCAAMDPVCCGNGTSFAAHLSYFTNENADEITNYVYGKYNATA